MNSRINRIIYLISVLVLIAVATLIVGFYVLSDSYSELTNIPPSIYVAAIIYILIQLIKRNVRKQMNWYDWLYYIGLAAIMFPFLLPERSEFYSVSMYGSIFLLLPPVVELITMLRTKR